MDESHKYNTISLLAYRAKKPYFCWYTHHMPVTCNTPIQTKHTFHLNVNAKYWAEYESVEELKEVLTNPEYASIPRFAIGGGSNLLFTKDYPGMLLHSAIKRVESAVQSDGTILVRAGSGVVWDDLVAYTVKNGWSGLENLSGIPGEVGASPVQNIGAYGAEAKDCIESVRILRLDTLEVETLSNADCCFGYRDSIFKHELKNRCIVLHVTYRLSANFNPNIHYGDLQRMLHEKGEITLKTLRETILEIRNAKLPNCDVVGNAGSFFMNPEISESQFQQLKTRWPEMPGWPQLNGKIKVSAAWCIEKAGWKGRKLGGAAVHDKQALVLINRENATADDILQLSNTIISEVKQCFDIVLTPEVIFV